jgi:hypothetical protein
MSLGLRILFEAAWPRYDDTFQQTLKNIAVHKEALDQHFHIRATQANLQHQREAREAHVIDTLAKHLDPANDGTSDLLRRVEQTLKEFPETGRWILAHPDFRNWVGPSKMDLSHRLLWLVGVPGAGKYAP